MGNTESAPLQMCQGKSLYTYANRKTLKEQMNTQRVSFNNYTKPQPKQAMKLLPTSCSQQQFGQSQRQQRQQVYQKEAPIELKVVQAPKQVEIQEVPQKQPSFNVYVDCIKDSLEEDLPLPVLEEDPTIQYANARDLQMQCFDGLFGNVIIHDNGLVLYTDINGEKYCEEFAPSGLSKVFPLGISGGDMSKSIWFNDVIERDGCFDAMTAQLKDITDPPAYTEVLANPEKYAAEEIATTDDEWEEEDEEEDDHVKVFEGLDGMQVIVHEDTLVLYTDINGDKHCRPYNPHSLVKIFPNGIAGGSLPKSIWFEEEQERDLCFALMQWNMNEIADEEIKPEPECFDGLYGQVTLKEGMIQYTSLTGDVIETYFEPDEIAPTFPMGISYGGLPKTIWFDDAQDREAALEAMRKVD